MKFLKIQPSNLEFVKILFPRSLTHIELQFCRYYLDSGSERNYNNENYRIIFPNNDALFPLKYIHILSAFVYNVFIFPFIRSNWILIIRVWYETSSVLIIEIKYDIIKTVGSDVSATELAKLHHVGKAVITDIKKQAYDIANYLKHLDFSDAGSNSRKTWNIPI